MEAITETPIFAPLFNRKHLKFGLWCNGSTTGFGSVCPGSNPGSPTNKGSDIPLRMSEFLFFSKSLIPANSCQIARKIPFLLTTPFAKKDETERKMRVQSISNNLSYLVIRQREACFCFKQAMFSLLKESVLHKKTVFFHR